MIKILNTSFNRLGVIKNAISSNRLEEINGENILDFEAVLDQKLNNFIDEDSIFELDNDWFDTAFLKKIANEDNTFTVEVESEHISYRLNREEYNVEFFTEMGDPTYILGKILDGTGFTIGTVEFSGTHTYSAQEAKSRRQLLMEFVAYLEGEVIFDKFEISIVQHRGSTETKPIIKDRNVKVVSKVVNKRQLDENGNPKVSYSCTPIYLPGDSYNLGDNIILMQKDLGIQQELRVVSISRDVYDVMNVTFQFANYTNGLESSLYRIATNTVAKDKLYNGCRIGPEFGFEAVRNDKKARAYFRSDGMKFQSGDGTGETWKDRLYFEYDAETDETVLMIDGKLSTEMIEALEAEFDFTISNTVIVNNLYSEYGRIANLSVSELNTGWKKITNYLLKDTDLTASKAPVYYKKDYEQYSLYFEAVTDGSETEQQTSRDDLPLYWIDESHTGMTLNDTGLPVLTYVYTDFLKMEISFRQIDGITRPRIIIGAGYGNPLFPERGKFIIDKATDAGILSYTTADGTEYSIEIGEDGIIQNGEQGLSALNFFANGFTADYGAHTVGYRWTKDGTGRITQLEDLYTGEIVPVTWGGGSL